MSGSNLDRLKEMAYACTRCGYCRDKYSDDAHTATPALRVCPVREHSGGFEHHFARGKLLIAQGLIEGRFSYSPELIDILYTDPDCALCTWVCNAEPVLDPPRVWRAMRGDIVAAGLGPPPPLKEIDTRVSTRHNVFGGKPELRSRWGEGLDLPRTGEVLYFAGCHAAYTQPEIARATIVILRKAGVNVACLGENEWCCGAVQFHDGSMGWAETVARHNIDAIRAAGAGTVVTGCAECYKSLKIDYPEMMGSLPFEVLHLSELLARLLSEGRVEPVRDLGEKRVAFHDPCRLGRYCGVYDPPRELLRSIPGIEVIEMPRHRQYAWCCGGGADLVGAMDRQLARDMARDRMEEAAQAGAEAVITACPRCARALRKASGGIQVYDLAVAMARSLGLGPG